ncbi:hypothetical protein AAFF_G00213010 [Aldrovandia affinis]|uniref:Uncharacterized protein n=1 Tax=Aldrovandia affinis TaxID=143900 RepID=A0AAD7RHC4_9TELE|nr:hypothetical protein AAFF_G00213010 [Aldrovandia affinis]
MAYHRARHNRRLIGGEQSAWRTRAGFSHKGAGERARGSSGGQSEALVVNVVSVVGSYGKTTGSETSTASPGPPHKAPSHVPRAAGRRRRGGGSGGRSVGAAALCCWGSVSRTPPNTGERLEN